jgi:cell division protein FtsI/penicillin-binding protein 2
MIRKRFLGIEIILFVFAAATISRLFYWQVLKHESFLAAAKSQTENTVYISAERGKILSSDGFLLVSNQKAYLVYAVLPEFKKQKKENQSYDELVKETVNKLTPVLLAESLPSQEDNSEEVNQDSLRDEIKGNITNELKQPKLVWVPLARKVDEDTKKKIERLKIEGIGFQDDTKRFYPEGNLAPNLLGFVAKDTAGNDKGYVGLEGYYDDKLKGKSGVLVQEVDSLGRPILIGSSEGSSVSNGETLVTTIDRTVQYTVENKLEEGVKRFGAKGGAALVMNPKTGGILASASYPSFNLTDPNTSKPETYTNLGISKVYEPGSIFKSITASAGLDSKSIDTKTSCPCTGPLNIAGYEVQTVNNEYYPNSNIADILQHSDNVGAVFVASRMGINKFLKYTQDFGFGEATGIDLQGEEAGIIKERKNWGQIDLATAAFGQGISVTALQMVSSLSTIANDGTFMKPYVVKEIKGQDKTTSFSPQKIRQVIQPSTAEVVKQLLLSAVENGEAKRIIPHGYRVAGKTGTAQVPIAGHYSTKTAASFIGFGPVEDPRFAMIIVLFEPSASIWASETSEPLFFEIAKELYPYWGIPVHQ